MIKRYLNPFLRTEATEHETAGGGAAGGAAAAAAKESSAEAKASVEEKPPGAATQEKREPTLVEKAWASIQGKGELLAQVNDLTAQLATATAATATAQAEVTRLNGELATAQAKIGTLEAERAEVDKALSGAKAERKTVDEAAARQLAQQGFDQTKLPAAEAEGGDTVESLTAKMNALPGNDPKRFALAAKINELIDGEAA